MPCQFVSQFFIHTSYRKILQSRKTHLHSRNDATVMQRIRKGQGAWRGGLNKFSWRINIKHLPLVGRAWRHHSTSHMLYRQSMDYYGLRHLRCHPYGLVHEPSQVILELLLPRYNWNILRVYPARGRAILFGKWSWNIQSQMRMWTQPSTQSYCST